MKYGRLSLFSLSLLLLAGAGHTEPRHGASTFGELALEPGFKHFPWVNPQAPKGGTLTYEGDFLESNFDSLNPFIVKGNSLNNLWNLFDTLLARNYDEPDAAYGLIAKSVDIAPDGKSVVFEMRPEARFNDGSPLTSADVVASFELLKTKAAPNYRAVMTEIAGAEALGPHKVRFTFMGDQTKQLPLVAGGLPIFSKKFYSTRDFAESTLEPPLGSGPYVVGKVDAGRSITMERAKNYWARNLPVNVGRWNFDTIRIDVFRDRAVAFEAFKAGALDFREENTAKIWAMEYNFPAIEDGRVKKAVFRDARASAINGLWMNMRREKFADARVRRALVLALDFEWMNKTLFYGSYTRINHLFQGSDQQSSGMPAPGELALLEPWRGKVPDAAFGPAPELPASDGSGNNRDNLRIASRLLEEAGYKVKNGVRTTPAGEPFVIEILTGNPASERVVNPYVQSLQRLGITASLRVLDGAGFAKRRETFDYDMLEGGVIGPNTQGAGMRVTYHSRFKDAPGSLNYAGIEDPAIDAMVEATISANSRAEMVTGTRALDRVFMNNFYLVPYWTKHDRWIAHWDRFGYPAKPAAYLRGTVTNSWFSETWWVDPEKDKALKR